MNIAIINNENDQVVTILNFLGDRPNYDSNTRTVDPGSNDAIAQLAQTYTDCILLNVDDLAVGSGWFWVPNSAPPQFLRSNKNLEELKADLKAEVDEIATDRYNNAIAKYSPGEMAGWERKCKEATAFLASQNPADAPNLGIESANRGRSLSWLAQEVLDNSERLRQLDSWLAGIRGKHHDQINATQNSEEALDYDVSRWW